MAKNRVAPLKPTTIPQLELLAALTGARMAKHILTTLKCSDVVYWSDSQIVLNWIHNSKQKKPFIERRIKEIKDLSLGYPWRYCPTHDNPADLLSRGISVTQFNECSVWMNGPSWITDETCWPQWNGNESIVLTTVECDISENDENDTPPETSGHTSIKFSTIDIGRFNSYTKLLRVTAYVKRFLRNCRRKSEDQQTGILLPEEINEASMTWIQIIQISDYGDVLDSLKSNSCHHLIRQLRLYLDDNGLIRCGGRINNAPIPFDARFPYLLPTKHVFTQDF